jgi:hypothetical protein
MKKRVSITLAEAVGAHLKQLRLYLPVLLSPVYPSVQTPTVSFGAILKQVFFAIGKKVTEVVKFLYPIRPVL